MSDDAGPRTKGLSRTVGRRSRGRTRTRGRRGPAARQCLWLPACEANILRKISALLILGVATFAAPGCAEKDRAPAPRRDVAASAPRRPRPPNAANTDAPLLRELLRAHEFRRLDSLFATYRDSMRADIAYEPLLLNSFDAFGIPDPSLRPDLDAWVTADSSTVAHLARASHSLGMGWAARGTAWARDTPREQLREMGEWFESAIPDIQAARQRDSTFLPAYWMLQHVAMGLGLRGDKRRIVEEALRLEPRSLLVRTRYLHSVTPRWGGSHAEMRRFAEESQRYVDQNPELAALLGFVAWDEGRSTRDRQAKLRKYTEALRYGDYWMFYADRAHVLYLLDQEEEAIADYDLALAQRPNDVETLVGRALAYWYLARKTPAQRQEYRRRAMDDFERAVQINPFDQDVRDALERYPGLAPRAVTSSQ